MKQILTAEGKLVVLLISGMLMLMTGGYLGWFGFPSIINNKIAKFKRLDNNESLTFFKKLPVPLEFKVYIFNVTNPDEVTTGAKPILQEVGPFVYEEYITKTILDSDDPNRIKYMKHVSFKFNAEKSLDKKETDLVTVINLPLLGMALFLERHMPLGIDLLEPAIPFLFPGKNKLFLTETIGNLLFHGVPIRCVDETLLFCTAMKTKSLQSITFDEEKQILSFAFFRQKNGTTGPYEIDAGLNDVRTVGRILSYRDSTVLDTWVPNSTCDALQGADSTLFAPFISKDEPLIIFEPDICLSGSAIYVGDENYLGMPASKFVGSRLNFEEEDTNCRCPREDVDDPSSIPECISPGLIDLTPCQGAPVLASQPYFYQGDERLKFSPFIKPSAEKHESFTLVDTLTGMPLEGRKRMQLNIELKPIEDVSILENVTTLVFPVVWVEEGISLDTNVLQPLIQLYTILSILNIAKWILLGIGILLLTVAVAYYFYRRHAKASITEIHTTPTQGIVLFSKVVRPDGSNGYPTDSTVNQEQISQNPIIRERLNHNATDEENNYIMTLRSSLYPQSLETRQNVHRKSLTHPT